MKKDGLHSSITLIATISVALIIGALMGSYAPEVVGASTSQPQESSSSVSSSSSVPESSSSSSESSSSSVPESSSSGSESSSSSVPESSSSSSESSSSSVPESSSSSSESSSSVPENPSSSSESSPPIVTDSGFVVPQNVSLKQVSTENVLQGRLPGFEDATINTDPTIVLTLLNHDVVTDDGIANVKIENNPGNMCIMQVRYYIEETGQEIYVSPQLKPNEHIVDDALSVELDAGEYKCIAVIYNYSLETNTLISVLPSDANLTISDGKFLGIF